MKGDKPAPIRYTTLPALGQGLELGGFPVHLFSRRHASDHDWHPVISAAQRDLLGQRVQARLSQAWES